MTDVENGSYAVLFVDDEEKTRKYFALGVQPVLPVLTAASVDEGIALLQSDGHRIGVLVTDQRMPEKNGVEILRYARENYPSIVRLLTTAYSDLEDAVSAVNSGEIVRYVRKPWQFEDLLQDIRQAMGYFQLGLERDRLLGEKLSIQRVDVLVQQVAALVEMGGTTWDSNGALSAVRAFLEDALSNGWLLSAEPGGPGQFEQWRWINEGLQRNFALASQLDWLRRPDGGFATQVDAAGLAALIMARGSWRSEGDAVCEGGTVNIDEAMISMLVEQLFGHADSPLPWLNGTLACTVEPLHDNSGMQVIVRAVVVAESVALDLYSALPLLSLYLVAHHHGGRCHVDHAAASIQMDLPAKPAPCADADYDIRWLEDLLGEMVMLARGDC